jgi:adenylate cyclase
MRVLFQPSAREVEAPAGSTVLDAALAAGLPIARACGAEGLCARCVVRILEGAESVEAEAPDETETKRRGRIDAELRLACRVRIRGPLTVTASYW